MFIKKLSVFIATLLPLVGCSAVSPSVSSHVSSIRGNKDLASTKQNNKYTIFVNENPTNPKPDDSSLKTLLSEQGYSLFPKDAADYQVSLMRTKADEVFVSIETIIDKRSLGCNIRYPEVNVQMFNQINACITIDQAMGIQRVKTFFVDQEETFPNLVAAQYLVAFTGKYPITTAIFSIDTSYWTVGNPEKIITNQNQYLLDTDEQYRRIKAITFGGQFPEKTTVRIYFKKITLEDSAGKSYTQEYIVDDTHQMEINT